MHTFPWSQHKRPDLHRASLALVILLGCPALYCMHSIASGYLLASHKSKILQHAVAEVPLELYCWLWLYFWAAHSAQLLNATTAALVVGTRISQICQPNWPSRHSDLCQCSTYHCGTTVIVAIMQSARDSARHYKQY